MYDRVNYNIFTDIKLLLNTKKGTIKRTHIFVNNIQANDLIL